ncbi:MAG: hypothetical protein NT023_08100 [Armatimonadetes bacterium]|nr:hypothetical protein [Armatimonadota bacterium]
MKRGLYAYKVGNMNERYIQIVRRLHTLWSLVVMVGLAGATALPTFAQATNYASTRQQIKACVLVSSASQNIVGIGPQNVTPHIFYALDSRIDVKPGGWEFTNPLAPSQVTAEMYRRWQLRGATDPAFTSGTPESLIFRIGASLTKNIGAYWEVNLDTVTDGDLRKYDVAFMAFRNNQSVSFTPQERKKLRGFVDAGGTLIIEDERNSNINPAAPFIVPLSFRGTVMNLAQDIRIAPAPGQRQNPILNYPYNLEEIDVRNVGTYSDLGRRVHYAPGSGTTPIDPRIFAPILLLRGGRNFYLSAGDFGAGHIIVSSAGLGRAVSGPIGGADIGEGANSGVVSGNNLINALTPELKLSYNIFAWASSVPVEGGNVRRTGGNSEHIGTQIARKWSSLPNGGSGLGSGAVVYKGGVFYVDNRSVLHAFKTNPGMRTDRSGASSDSGIRDYQDGAPFDEIWNKQLPSGSGVRYSTPVAYSIFNNSTNRSVDIVLVTSSTGITYAHTAFARTAGFLNSAPTLLWQFGSGGGSLLSALGGGLYPVPVPSPAVTEGVVYTYTYNEAGDANHPWRIAALDPVTGVNLFGLATGVAPSVRTDISAALPGLPPFMGSLTAGYVRDRATSALDKVVYVTSNPYNTEKAGAINTLWFATKGEPLQAVPGDSTGRAYQPNGDRKLVPWYAGNVVSLQPIVTLITHDVNGNVTNSQILVFGTDYVANYVGTGGSHQMQILLTSITPDNSTQQLLADYTLNWPGLPIAGTQVNMTDMQRFTTARYIKLPAPGTMPKSNIPVGTAALDRQDHLVVSANWDDPTLPGRVYSMREQYNSGNSGATRGQRGAGTETAWMFAPHFGGTFNGINMPPRLVNTDTYKGQIPTGQQYISSFQPIGAPAVVNGIVYVVAQAKVLYSNQSTSFNATLLLALRANPNMTFSIGRSIPTNASAIRVRQVDTLQSDAANVKYITLSEGRNFSVDRDTGTISITDSMEARNDALNTSLPVRVLINVPGNAIPDEVEVRDPLTGNGPLDNVAWYMILPQDGITLPPEIQNTVPASGPSVIGDTLYFGTADGYIAAVDIQGASGGAQAQTFAKGRYRWTKTGVLPNSSDGTPLNVPIINPPVGSANLLASAAHQGVSALEQQITLVADNNRLLEVDVTGSAVWALEGTRALNPVFTSGGQTSLLRTALSRPNSVRQTSLNTFIIADSGNNRVVQVDKSGYVRTELKTVSNGLQILRPGDPISLNTPTDVQTYTESTGFDTGTLTFSNLRTGVNYSFTGSYYAVHYIIADSGNYRIVEVVDAFQLDGRPVLLSGSDGSSVAMQKQVVFASSSLSEKGSFYRYRTLQQFIDPTSPTNDVFLIAAVDNIRVNAEDPMSKLVGNAFKTPETLGGAIVALRRNPPAPARDGDIAFVITSLSYLTANVDAMGNPVYRNQPLSNPTWFKEFDLRTPGGLQPRYLLVDDNGCYMLKPGVDSNNNALAIVDWALTADDYYKMTGRRLRAASIQKLNLADFYNGNFYPRFLITNRYVGEDNVPDIFNLDPFTVFQRSQVRGEVFEIRSVDFYNGGLQSLYLKQVINGVTTLVKNPTASITWLFPNETIIDRVGGIPGRIKRTVGVAENATTTYLLEQPTFSERPF